MVLREVVEHARAAGIERLLGVYRPTDKNKLVEDHYSKLGFTRLSDDGSGTTRWALDLAAQLPDPAPMKVTSQGFLTLVSR